MEESYQVYVLQNESGKRYIGLSEDIEARLVQHNNGESKWTSKFRPWRIVWASRKLNLSAARKLENRLKRAKGGNGFYEITGLERTNGSESR